MFRLVPAPHGTRFVSLVPIPMMGKTVVGFNCKIKTLFASGMCCGLLLLNSRARGWPLTSQLTWEAAWLLVTRICPVYLVDEFDPCVLCSVWLFFLDDEYGFTSIGSWCYSRECVRNLSTKVRCIASGKGKVSRVSLQGLDVSYLIYQFNQFDCMLMA